MSVTPALNTLMSPQKQGSWVCQWHWSHTGTRQYESGFGAAVDPGKARVVFRKSSLPVLWIGSWQIVMLAWGGHCPGNPAPNIKDRHLEVCRVQPLADAKQGNMTLWKVSMSPGPLRDSLGTRIWPAPIAPPARVQDSQPRSSDLPGILWGYQKGP